MQSDLNIFWGYVVLDIFNKALRDEDSILNQIYEKQISSKDPQIFAFHKSSLKCFFIPIYHFNVGQDNISSKTVPIWLHHTVCIHQ